VDDKGAHTQSDLQGDPSKSRKYRDQPCKGAKKGGLTKGGKGVTRIAATIRGKHEDREEESIGK